MSTYIPSRFVSEVENDLETYYNHQKEGKSFASKTLSFIDDREEYKTLEDGITKERRPLFFCSGVRYTWDPDKKQFLVAINHYKLNGRQGAEVQVKFHGGCSEKGEIPRRTLQREMMTETGKFMSTNCPLIHHRAFRYRPEEIEQDRSKQGKLEHLHLFFADEVKFEHRNTFIKTKTGSDEGESSPVTWEVIDQTLVSKIFKSHYLVLEKLHKLIWEKYGMTNADKAMAIVNIKFAQGAR
jgi:hypothetical protein